MSKINIILPYKETYSDKNAGAVSILASEFSRFSYFKKNIKVFGSLQLKKPLTNNYIAVIKKKPLFYLSRTFYYLKLINKKIKDSKNSIIEIHNRPQAAIFFINKKKKCKKILYFHNNPKELRGSKSVKQRTFLLDNLDKIIFVSEWCKRKFFEELKLKNHEKCHVIYPGSVPLKKTYKKNNNIVFAGKLNEAKGYYVFLEAVFSILKKYKDWKAIIIGDDPRKYKILNHSNIIYTGWIAHKKTLAIFKKSKIAVIPSAWDEPLGRTSIEAASCGCATILSKKGGLPETNLNGIFIENVTSKILFKKLDKIIADKKLLKKLMEKNLDNFKLTLKKTILDSDNIYKELLK